MRDQVDFLHVDIHESFLQVGTNVSEGCDLSYPNTQNNKSAIF